MFIEDCPTIQHTGNRYGLMLSVARRMSTGVFERTLPLLSPNRCFDVTRFTRTWIPSSLQSHSKNGLFGFLGRLFASSKKSFSDNPRSDATTPDGRGTTTGTVLSTVNAAIAIV